MDLFWIEGGLGKLDGRCSCLAAAHEFDFAARARKEFGASEARAYPRSYHEQFHATSYRSVHDTAAVPSHGTPRRGEVCRMCIKCYCLTMNVSHKLVIIIDWSGAIQAEFQSNLFPKKSLVYEFSALHRTSLYTINSMMVICLYLDPNLCCVIMQLSWMKSCRTRTSRFNHNLFAGHIWQPNLRILLWERNRTGHLRDGLVGMRPVWAWQSFSWLQIVYDAYR